MYFPNNTNRGLVPIIVSKDNSAMQCLKKERVEPVIFFVCQMVYEVLTHWTQGKVSIFALTRLNELFWLWPNSLQTHPKCFLGSLRSILVVLGNFPSFSLQLTSVMSLLLLTLKRGSYALQALHLLMPAKDVMTIVLKNGWCRLLSIYKKCVP